MEWIERLEPVSGAWTREQLNERCATEPAVIAAAVREIGQGATSWAVDTAATIVNRLRTAGDSVVPRSSTGHDAEGCENGLLTGLMMIRRGAFDPELVRDDALLHLARVAFRQGMPLEVLSHRIWASHTASLEAILGAIDRLVPPEDHLKVIQRINQVMFTYGNSYVSALAEAYEDERRAWRGRLPLERRRILLEVADGTEPPADAEEILGGSLLGGHLHALAWAAGHAHIPDRETHVDDWAIRVAEHVGAHRMVSFLREGMMQLWWSFAGPVTADTARLVREVPRPAWLRVGVGPHGAGVEGFRASHHGAGVAAEVGRAAVRGDFWEYDDVALLGLAIADRAHAAAFVRRVLGDLLTPGERFAELRETVRRYLSEGNSRVAVARDLHVAPTTVAYRVSQAGAIIGEAVSVRPLEVRLALELVHHFPDLVGLAPAEA